jgi:hypothetical protein
MVGAFYDNFLNILSTLTPINSLELKVSISRHKFFTALYLAWYKTLNYINLTCGVEINCVMFTVTNLYLLQQVFSTYFLWNLYPLTV